MHRAVPLPAAVSGQGYRTRHHTTRTTAPLGSSIIRHYGHDSHLVDTVLHIFGRHQFVDLWVARRCRLHGTASRLCRNPADYAAGPQPTNMAHYSRHCTLCSDCCAANRLAIHRPHNSEQDLWTDSRRGLYYIYGDSRETIWAVVARQLCRPGAQGGVAQPYAAHRPHTAAHEL